MTQYVVRFTPGAERDQKAIYDWVAAQASEEVAGRFLHGLLTLCNGLQTAPLRGKIGRLRNAQVRVIGYRRTVSIMFTVSSNTVSILRLLYRGRNLTTAPLR